MVGVQEIKIGNSEKNVLKNYVENINLKDF